MKKIITLFQRNYETDRLVRDEVVPGAEWVLAGEGIATRKYDGTCCLLRDGKLFKRYDLPLLSEWERKKKNGYKGPWTPPMYKQSPDNWEMAQDEPDENTGHWPGWLPVGDGQEDRWHREALVDLLKVNPRPQNGTYELLGPKIQGNPEGCGWHRLQPHALAEVLSVFSRTFDGLKAFLSSGEIEGIVFHHPDGRMVKIKAKDFGIKRRKVSA